MNDKMDRLIEGIKQTKVSKVKELLNEKDSVLVFDVDGVLALLEWGTYNHYALNDDEWTKACEKGVNGYTQDKVCNKIKDFLANKDMSRIYVITTVGNNNEGTFKKEFANKYYNIPKENVYYVENNSQKTETLIKIKQKYPELEDYKIVMIDDTVSILNDIMEKTNFSTVHNSSFLDI